MKSPFFWITSLSTNRTFNAGTGPTWGRMVGPTVRILAGLAFGVALGLTVGGPVGSAFGAEPDSWSPSEPDRVTILLPPKSLGDAGRTDDSDQTPDEGGTPGTENPVGIDHERKTRVVTGTILSITGRDGVQIQLPTEKTPIRLPLTSILDITTDRSPSHVAAEEAFHEGETSRSPFDFSRALQLFQEARKEEKRDWVRQLLTARIVDSLTALGETERAADEFFRLCRSDPLPPYLSSIPLPWNAGFSNARLVNSAKYVEWLEPEKNPSGKWNPAGRLLAASLLLGGADRNRGIEALQELAVTRNPAPGNPDVEEYCRTISLLASAQLWRMKLPLSPKREEIDRWREALDRFPAPFAAGPTRVVALALEKAGDSDAADELNRKTRLLWPLFFLPRNEDR